MKTNNLTGGIYYINTGIVYQGGIKKRRFGLTFGHSKGVDFIGSGWILLLLFFSLLIWIHREPDSYGKWPFRKRCIQFHFSVSDVEEAWDD